MFLTIASLIERKQYLVVEVIYISLWLFLFNMYFNQLLAIGSMVSAAICIFFLRIV